MEKYSFKEFYNDLSIGREIEFEYKGKKYSITKTPNGWSFSRFYEVNVNNIQNFSTYQELITAAKIDDNLFMSVFDEIVITTIY